MSENQNKSLLKCTLRKSADVFAKLVLYASYAVCGATALVLAVYGMLAVASVIADPIRIVITAIWGAVAFSGSLAAAIPWYVYVGIAAVAAIPVYSLLWCIARELTEEDWDAEIGWVGLISIVPALCCVPICIFQEVVDGDTNLKKYTVKKLTLCDVVFLFPNAYLHYRKRMKEERK